MKFRRFFEAVLVLAALVGSAQNAIADEQGEANFRALRTKVGQLRSKLPLDEQKRIDSNTPKIYGCLPGTPEPEHSRAGIALDDVDYKYATPAVTPDDVFYCFFIVEPLHRALTSEEGRDFSAALMMREIPHTSAGAGMRVKLELQRVEGEKRFTELRNALKSRSFTRLEKPLWNFFDADSSKIVDCQESELSARGASYARELFNDYYTFMVLETTGGRCILIETPVRRGLKRDEGIDLVNAMQLDMGFTDERRQELFGDGPVPADFQDPR